MKFSNLEVAEERIAYLEAAFVELFDAVEGGVDMLDEYVRQTMEANPEWRTGYKGMRDARMKYLAQRRALR